MRVYFSSCEYLPASTTHYSIYCSEQIHSKFISIVLLQSHLMKNFMFSLIEIALEMTCSLLLILDFLNLAKCKCHRETIYTDALSKYVSILLKNTLHK